jgi:ribonuclease Z
VKKKIIFSILIVVLIVVGTVSYSIGLFGILSGGPKKRLNRVDRSVLTDPGIHVIMAGTGTPNYDPTRNPVCVGVIAGGEFMMFDTGNGCTKTVELMNLPVLKVHTVFLTHFHSDHINDLGHLIGYTWVRGRRKQIHVYGPPGVRTVVDGFALAAKEDINIRSNIDSLFPLDARLAVAKAHEFVYPEDGSSITVWQKNGVVVKAFKNDHYDVKISCGYRVEYAGRSVVISGDTIKSDFVIRNAKDADILIHEAVNKDLVQEVTKMIMETGKPFDIWRARHSRRAAKHHIGHLEVAEVAQAAGVGKLVLYHIGPPIPDVWLIKRRFMKGMPDIYAGPIHISKDKDRFYLEPGQ